MSRFLNDKYNAIEPYIPGEQPQNIKYIKLNTNESPYPPSPETVDAICKEQVLGLRLYSDPECKTLIDNMAKLYKIKPSQLYFSNGSDDILNFAFMAFSGNGTGVAFPDISYGFYKVFSSLYQTKYQQIPLREDFSINYKDYCNLNKFIVIANPNAPTGLTLTLPEIEEILKTNPNNIVLIDEAYIDFGAQSCYHLINTYDNLLVVQTFSKSRSLAGARLGFAIASEEIIEDLNKIKYSTNPYNINRLSLIAGAAAIKSQNYYDEMCDKIKRTRQYTINTLRLMGFVVLNSKANFVFTKYPGLDGEYIYKELKKHGILVRHFSSERIKDYNRITIGTDEEMEIFFKTISKILKNI